VMIRVWEPESGTAGFGPPEEHELRFGKEPI
jgi:hypothetical protein